jgi:transcriptional regulator with PAS, ATPase and Fis domain
LGQGQIPVQGYLRKNPVFLKAIDQAKLIARSNSNILLLGESGTGKDILAQAIHNASRYQNGPYVAINCAAIPVI